MDHAHSCLVIPIFIWYSIPRCSITDAPYLQPPKVAAGDMSQRSVVTGVPSELERCPQRRGLCILQTDRYLKRLCGVGRASVLHQ